MLNYFKVQSLENEHKFVTGLSLILKSTKLPYETVQLFRADVLDVNKQISYKLMEIKLLSCFYI